MSNDLEAHFYNNSGRLLHKWLHYFAIYDRHFMPFRDRPITLVEIGVYHGGSLQMWKKYFGPQARIIGVDIDPRCSAFEDEQVEIIIGDQNDPAFLRQLRAEAAAVDVVIDDGGHRMSEQLRTFEELWPAVTDGGVYLVEDLHTSYWPEYGGSYLGPNTFIEFSKSLVDKINAWHTRGSCAIDTYTRSLGGMHVYDSVIVFDKAKVEEPMHRLSGVPSFDLSDDEQSLLLSHSASPGTNTRSHR